MDTINNQCFRTPPNDPKFPYLFYTDETNKKHNESTFQNEGDVFILCAQDKHHDTCLQSFQLQNDANYIARLHLEVQLKKYVG